MKIAVSSCLLGQKVRYDGEHQSDAYINEVLATKYTLLPFCPEMAIGLGVPRLPIHLVEHDDGIHCVRVDDDQFDVTEPLRQLIDSASWLNDVCGFILKSKSPSCGLSKVKLLKPEGVFREGQGIWAKALLDHYPYLPVIDEVALSDTKMRSVFLRKVDILATWFSLQQANEDYLAFDRYIGVLYKDDNDFLRALNELRQEKGKSMQWDLNYLADVMHLI